VTDHRLPLLARARANQAALVEALVQGFQRGFRCVLMEPGAEISVGKAISEFTSAGGAESKDDASADASVDSSADASADSSVSSQRSAAPKSPEIRVGIIAPARCHNNFGMLERALDAVCRGLGREAIDFCLLPWADRESLTFEEQTATYLKTWGKLSAILAAGRIVLGGCYGLSAAELGAVTYPRLIPTPIDLLQMAKVAAAEGDEGDEGDAQRNAPESPYQPMHMALAETSIAAPEDEVKVFAHARGMDALALIDETDLKEVVLKREGNVLAAVAAEFGRTPLQTIACFNLQRGFITVPPVDVGAAKASFVGGNNDGPAYKAWHDKLDQDLDDCRALLHPFATRPVELAPHENRRMVLTPEQMDELWTPGRAGGAPLWEESLDTAPRGDIPTLPWMDEEGWSEATEVQDFKDAERERLRELQAIS